MNNRPPTYYQPPQYGQQTQYSAPPQYGQQTQYSAPPQYGQQTQYSAPPQYGQQTQYSAPPQYGQQPQYSAPPQYGQQAQYSAPPQYGQQTQYSAPPQYGQQTQYSAPPQYGQQTQYGTLTQYAPPRYAPPQYGAYRQPPVMYPATTAQYQYPAVPMYYTPPEVVNKQLFRKHCSRAGLMLMADLGIMFGVELLVLIIGAVVFYLLRERYFPGVEFDKAITVILMSSGGISAVFAHLIPASAHGHKWRIRFTDPFRGDSLSAGFVTAAALTALGLNSLWGYCYYFLKDWLDATLQTSTETTELYTPENMPLLGFWLMIFWSCVIAPVTEEYMFRGILLRTLSKHGAAFGIVISALCFGLMHGNMGQTPMAFLIGLIMGYVAAKSGNIRQTIFIHMVNNILASLPEVIHYFTPQYDDYYSYVAFVFDIFTVGFAVCALIWFAVKRHNGLRSRRLRQQSSIAPVSKAESDWIKLEIPDERRVPQFRLVSHPFAQCLSSGGMLFFELSMLLLIFLGDVLPYLSALLSQYAAV